MSLDAIPLSVILLATMALVLLALQIGVGLGRRRLARGAGKLEVSGAMVGAALGLMAFMLAFTFNAAAGRHDARKKLVIEEVNAIETTWLRAGFLPEPARTTMRGLLKQYVGVRVKVALGHTQSARTACIRPTNCTTACGRWPSRADGGSPARLPSDSSSSR